jgi:hypothetical protein
MAARTCSRVPGDAMNARALALPLLPYPAMTRVCAYCHAEMGFTPCEPRFAGQETHGICPRCEERVRKEFGL